MGSGLSINHKQLTEIIKRDLIKSFNEDQAKLPLYTDDGFIIYRDFTEEEKLKNKIKEINEFLYKNKK
jgi:hypothetical protein